MKTYHLIPLLFLTACSTTPKLTLQPQPPRPVTNNTAVRYPEIVNAYHIGRYVDPNNDLVMHEQHVVYRVEENTRWDFHPGTACIGPVSPTPRDVAFSPTPVNDAVLAEVNAQRLATTQIMMETRTLSTALAKFQAALQQTKTNLQETAALRATVIAMRRRLDALETAQTQLSQPFIAPATNPPPDSLNP
jgi:hypothetical protein